MINCGIIKSGCDDMKDVNILTLNGIDVNHGIELLGDMETYNSIIEDFYNGYNERMQKINGFKNNSDMANYAIEVHSLKSDSKYLGFMKLAEIAYQHEMASKANDINTVNNSYSLLINEANRVIAVVKKYLEGTISKEPQVNPIPQVNPTTSNVVIPTIVDGNNVKKEENVSSSFPTMEVSNTNATKTILVADDSSIIRDFVNEIFSNEYQVLDAANGEEVINIIKSNASNIKALLLDLNMPGVDGFGVLDYFKENDLFKSIPVSIISGADDKESIDRAFKYPIVDMLNKPFSKETVKSVVEKTIKYNSIS